MTMQIQGLPEIMTTKEQAVQACAKLADMYALQLVGEDALRSTLSSWLTNCPFLLEGNSLDPSISKRIGKKRTIILTAALNSLLAG